MGVLFSVHAMYSTVFVRAHRLIVQRLYPMLIYLHFFPCRESTFVRPAAAARCGSGGGGCCTSTTATAAAAGHRPQQGLPAGRPTEQGHKVRKAVLWIRIRKDPKLFAGSGSVT
jgi:hypothetical protein